MRRAAALLVLLAAAACAADPAPRDQWLMMVRTENSDPAQEAAFNHWYDDIDIPDVLKVPGYQRARRGVEQPGAPNRGEGHYIALYDIQSTDIERTIESMNQLARDMPKQGRATPLLKVTERIYYRLYRVARDGTPAASVQPEFLVVARFAPAGDATQTGFDAWYDGALGAALAKPGVLRATRYELHRVRMDQPIEVPRFLTVFEVAAPDAAAAHALVTLEQQDAGARRATALDTNVFRKTKDVPRPAAAH